MTVPPFPRKLCINETGEMFSYPCLMTGDPRAVTPALMVQHTIWLRYHNYLVHKLKKINLHWSAESWDVPCLTCPLGPEITGTSSGKTFPRPVKFLTVRRKN